MLISSTGITPINYMFKAKLLITKPSIYITETFQTPSFYFYGKSSNFILLLLGKIGLWFSLFWRVGLVGGCSCKFWVFFSVPMHFLLYVSCVFLPYLMWNSMLLLSFFMNTECKSSFIKAPNNCFTDLLLWKYCLLTFSLFIELILPLQHNY